MITLIVPTRNRAHTLRLVAPSYFQQEAVTEIIVVNDAGSDDTAELVQRLATGFPQVRARCLSNASRVGASQSRNLGVSQATNPYILFCDDDEYLEPGYAKTCLRKLLNFNAGAVSGRRIYLNTGESQQAALRRFGHGIRRTSPFRSLICEYVNAARFDGDLRLPITNAIILTRKALLEEFPFDAHYARGNGYREESDFQMNLFVNDYAIYVTNECHSFHLPKSLVAGGGQRVPKLRRLYWSIHYTRYFYRKYYTAYASKLRLRSPRAVALWAFTIFAIYRETLRPPLYAVVKWMLRLRQRMAVVEMPT